MLLNYLKIAYRHLNKNRAFSLINIFGLTIGFLCFILIALYIHDELNYDRMHRDGADIYRVIQHETMEDGALRKVSTVAGRIGPESVSQLPEVADVVRISVYGRLTMGNDPETRGYEVFTVADSGFFNFFDFKLLKGNPNTALTEPNSIVISQKLANRYFGTGDAVGKMIKLNDNDMNVAGVMQDFPTNSHIQIDLLLSEAAVDQYFPWYRRFESSDWVTNSFATYVKLKPGQDKTSYENKLTQLVKQNYPSDKEFKSTFTLQPLADIHLYSSEIQDYQVNNSGFTPFYIYMFSVVALLILLIAALNYMNLSTAAAYKRTKEIGTRKTLGAGKASLIGQFMGEATMLSLISLVIAVALLQVIMPFVNEFANKRLSLSTLPFNWAAIIALTLIGCGILASLYPAFIVSRVSPVQAIKKEVRFASQSIPVRKVLVVAQFAISIIMISSTLIIYRQLNFMREKALGFDVENLVTVDINSGILRRQFEAVKHEFSQLTEVQKVAVSSRVPGEWKRFPIATVSRQEESIKADMIYVGVDSDFLSTYNIQLQEGRNFGNSPGDSTKVILTRLAVDQLGLKNPIGQVVVIPTVTWGGQIENLEQPFYAEVIGVVDNFYFESFRKKMMPLIFAYHNNPIHSIDYYTLRIKSSNWEKTLSELKRINEQFDPKNPVEYNFLDSKFAEFYQSDTKRGQIFLAFSSIIVLIACLGLFALVSFSIENRKKEIGVRKVLGASTESILNLLSKEFMMLVVIAFVIATPLVILTMRSWLSEFAYHVNFGVGTFALSGIIAILIAFVTISFRSIKAAVANPVDSLRSE